MSKSEFDQLSSLTSDWRFRRTLEDLFRLCTPETESRRRPDSAASWPLSASCFREKIGSGVIGARAAEL